MTRPHEDPLFVVNSKRPCPVCLGDRHRRKVCVSCKSSGFLPVDISNLWFPAPGFLVGGGPSLNKIPFQRLRERGVVSLAINNTAGYVPVTSWVFSDPQNKFHHGVHLDPKVLTFSPIPKLRKNIRVKLPSGEFRQTEVRVKDCPGVYGFNRTTNFDAETFLTSETAYWGYGGSVAEDKRPFTCLCTMLLGLRLLHYLGCPKVYMIGVDFWRPEDQQYAFKQSAARCNRRYIKENRYLEELKPHFDKVGFKVYNCNPESKCDVFEHVPFEEAIMDCKGAVPNEPFDLSDWYSKELAEAQIKDSPQAISLEQLKELQNANP